MKIKEVLTPEMSKDEFIRILNELITKVGGLNEAVTESFKELDERVIALENATVEEKKDWWEAS